MDFLSTAKAEHGRCFYTSGEYLNEVGKSSKEQSTIMN